MTGNYKTPDGKAWSYQTIIREFDAKGREHINVTNYSSTTSSLQGELVWYFVNGAKTRSEALKAVRLENVPKRVSVNLPENVVIHNGVRRGVTTLLDS